MSTGLAVRSPVNVVNSTKVNTSEIEILMQRGPEKKNQNLEGLILCQNKERGLYSVNHWEPLADFKQSLERSDVQFRWSMCPIMWRMDLKGVKLQAIEPVMSLGE